MATETKDDKTTDSKTTDSKTTDSKTTDSSTTVGIGDIRKFVIDTVSDVLKSGKRPESKDEPAGSESVADQVTKALADIKAKEEKETERTNINNKLKELEDRTAEKPPVERRRVHRFMGWGE